MAKLTATDEFLNNIFFGYQPNVGLCIAAIVVFIVLFIATSIQNYRTKSWYMFVVSATALTELGGYVARYFLANIKSTQNAFIAMDVLLILSPNALALVNYWTVGMIVARATAGGQVKGAFSWVTPKTISALFLTSDFIAFGVQGAAAGLLTSSDQSQQKPGQQTMLTGLGIQMGFFTLFSVITIYSHRAPQYGLRNNATVKPAFIALYITIVLLTLRSIYRFIEFADPDGYIARHEVFFYIFDALVVIGSMITYIILPFGRYLDFEVDRSQSSNSKMYVEEAKKAYELEV